VLWFWIFVGPGLALAILALRGERKRAEYVASRMAELTEVTGRAMPPVTLIVPVAGSCELLRESLLALASQDYPDYEMIVAVADSGALPPGALPSGVKVALIGRIGSLRNGCIRAARRRSQIFAFAGPGGLVSKAGLRALVAPLSEEGVGASTGFRWYASEPPTFWTLVQSVWNGVIAGRLGPGSNDFAWAGAMAISKATFFEARVPELWTGAG
jgi:ceramide glucosyltransferase